MIELFFRRPFFVPSAGHAFRSEQLLAWLMSLMSRMMLSGTHMSTHNKQHTTHTDTTQYTTRAYAHSRAQCHVGFLQVANGATPGCYTSQFGPACPGHKTAWVFIALTVGAIVGQVFGSLLVARLFKRSWKQSVVVPRHSRGPAPICPECRFTQFRPICQSPHEASQGQQGQELDFFGFLSEPWFPFSDNFCFFEEKFSSKHRQMKGIFPAFFKIVLGLHVFNLGFLDQIQ